MRSNQARISESTAIRENLLGFGKSTLTCLPAIAAEKGKAVLAVEGAAMEPGKESEAEGPAIPDSLSW